MDYYRCVLLIKKFSKNYLCLLFPLSGIFPSKSLERSPLRPFGLESKSARKQSKSNAKLIYRTHLYGTIHGNSRERINLCERIKVGFIIFVETMRTVH